MVKDMEINSTNTLSMAAMQPDVPTNSDEVNGKYDIS